MTMPFELVKEFIEKDKEISSLHRQVLSKLKDCKTKDDIIQFAGNYPHKAPKNKIIRFYEENKEVINEYLYQEIQSKDNNSKSVKDLVAHEDYRAVFDDTDVLFLGDDNRYFIGKWGMIYVFTSLLVKIQEWELTH